MKIETTKIELSPEELFLILEFSRKPRTASEPLDKLIDSVAELWGELAKKKVAKKMLEPKKATHRKRKKKAEPKKSENQEVR